MIKRITQDLYVDPLEVLAVEFKNAVWDRDEDSRLFVGEVAKSKAIIHLRSGNTVAFELGEMRPETVLELFSDDDL